MTAVRWPLVIAAFVALSAADLLLTGALLARGASELNPVMASLLDAGPEWAALFKATITVGVAAGLWRGREHAIVRHAGLGFVALLGAVVTYEVVNLGLA